MVIPPSSPAGGDADGGPVDRLVQVVYPELKRLAQNFLARADRNHQLTPSGLVSDAYARLRQQNRIAEDGTTLFKRCFAREYRRILVDTIRAQRAQKRGGAAVRLTLSECGSQIGIADDERLLAVHEALERLQQQPRHGDRIARVVEMRMFGDMTVTECAAELRVSPRTVDGDWAFAVAWLRRELEP